MTEPAPLTRLEVASGVVVGADPAAAPLPAYDGRSPRAALEAALLPALTRAPCVVSFSGGRDSSAVLALATHVARREGLAAPIPVTLRYPKHDVDAEENSWQELVVTHLQLRDWQHVDIDDELDLIGPVAQGVLRRHGLLYPPNIHAHVPLLAHARGGSLLTGVDGDGLLSSWIWAGASEVLGHHRAPRPRDVLRLGFYTAPQRLHMAVFGRRLRRANSWLTARADRARIRAEARELADEPKHWPRWVAWWRSRRYLALNLHGYGLLGAEAEVRIDHPLLDPGFLSSLAHTAPGFGPGDRTEVMRMLFPDVLPDEVLARDTKATFDASFWHRHSRAFADRWDGGHVDTDLVDAARLRTAWRLPRPPVNSATLLQATWLASEG